MAVLKVACPKCGQKVSGDDSFFGTSVECPVCTSKIAFPDKPGTEESTSPDGNSLPKEDSSTAEPPPVPKEERNEASEDTSTIALPPQPAGRDQFGGFGEESSPVLGVISMVVGIITVLCLCLPGILLGPIAVICGHMGVSRAKHSSIRPAPGETLALTGLILGYVGMAVSLVYLVMLAFPDFPQSVRDWLSGSET